VHNHTNGIVDIEVGTDYFKITNSGAAAALDQEKIFRRFHKGSADKNNTGLGLAIVKAIVDLYGLKIDYLFDGKHVTTVSFPIPSGFAL
jgi:signal transduction histidine kinase